MNKKDMNIDSLRLELLKAKEGKKILIALPAYNEENFIAKILVGCKKIGLTGEVVVVDDGSEDATFEIAEELGASVVRHDKNKGYGAAIRTCFEVAKEKDVDLLIILDADGQHDPIEIIKFLSPYNDGADIIIGSRANNKPVFRNVGNTILDIMTSKVGGHKVSDSQSGFRAYSRKAINVIKINNNGMYAGSEILLQAKEKKLKIEEVNITCNYDKAEPSQHPIIHGMSVFSGICSTIINKKPLLYFSSIGIIFLISGSGVGVWSFGSYIESGHLPFGPSIIVILLLSTGSSLILGGFILHRISAIIKELKEDN